MTGLHSWQRPLLEWARKAAERASSNTEILVEPPQGNVEWEPIAGPSHREQPLPGWRFEIPAKYEIINEDPVKYERLTSESEISTQSGLLQPTGKLREDDSDFWDEETVPFREEQTESSQEDTEIEDLLNWEDLKRNKELTVREETRIEQQERRNHTDAVSRFLEESSSTGYESSSSDEVMEYLWQKASGAAKARAKARSASPTNARVEFLGRTADKCPAKNSARTGARIRSGSGTTSTPNARMLGPVAKIIGPAIAWSKMERK